MSPLSVENPQELNLTAYLELDYDIHPSPKFTHRAPMLILIFQIPNFSLS